MPPRTQKANPMMNTAPKMVTRDSVFVLRWKICAIRACYRRTVLPRGRSAIISKSRSDARLARRHTTGYDERHQRRARHHEPLDPSAWHHDDAAGHAIGERQIDGDVPGHVEEGQIILRDEAERADVVGDLHGDRLVEAFLVADKRLQQVADRR